jgi:hypothetical protein
VAFSPQANYSAAGEVNADFMWVKGVTAFNLGFLDRSRYFFFQVARQLSSQG